jgi:hypothetical protein
VYDYTSDVIVFSDERTASHKLLVSLGCDVRVTPVWSPDNHPEEKILQFQVFNLMILKCILTKK